MTTAPAFGRRHDLGAASARSLLLTVLGELVLPVDEPVWSAAYLTVLGRLGVEEKAARQALSRAAVEGWLVPQRDGRRTAWRLAPAGRTMLASGARRIYGHARDDAAWAGDWLVVTTMSDGDRRLRHRLGTRLAWNGLGRLGPGLWVGAHVERQADLRRDLVDAGVEGSVTVFLARIGELGDPVTVAQTAWDLDDIARQYDEFVGAVSDLRPTGGEQTLTALLRLVQEWRRFPFIDPDLPAELLPTGWNGHRAAAVFAECRRAWQRTARREWERLRRL